MTTLFPVTRMLDSVFNGNVDSSDPHTRISRLIPRADVYEGDKEFRILMDLPGVNAENLELNLEGPELSVKAVKGATVPEGFKLRRNERAGEVEFSRTFTVGNTVDAEKISASLNDGVLDITLPKSDVSLPRRIEVK